MKKWLLVFTVLYCLSLWGCGNKTAGNGETTDATGDSQSADATETTFFFDEDPTKETIGEPENDPPKTTEGKQEDSTAAKPTTHQHSFGMWIPQSNSTCAEEGLEKRTCKTCKADETRPIAKKPHTYKAGNNYYCSTCMTVNFESNASVIEMGTIAGFSSGNIANYIWDVHIFDGKAYVGSGDYDKNAGEVRFNAFNLETNAWEKMQDTTDMAIHTFVEIGGKLYAPGIDSTDSDGWAWGNYYVLENGKWVKHRNIPNGIHCFDMIGFDNKIFMAMGGNNEQQMIAVSSDGGKTFSHLPIYRGSNPLNPSGYDPKWFRGYDFVEYKGNLYALLTYRLTSNGIYAKDIYRYDGDKMVYVGRDNFSGRVGRNYWQAAFEWKDTCYIAAKGLFAITDFSSTTNNKQAIAMPGGEIVSDAILHNDTMYTLGYTENADGSYQVVIYKSTTGAAGSFTQVASFKYEGIPYSFDFDGSYFYVGIGQPSANDTSKAGMLLRVKP